MTRTLKIITGVIIILVWAYIAAFALGPQYRFLENSVTAVCGFYAAYKLLRSSASVVGIITALLFVGVGVNAVIEASLFLYTSTYLGESISISGNWYSFGNHIRNAPVIAAALVLSGLVMRFSTWLESVAADG